MNTYKIEDLSIGMSESFSVTITEEMMHSFSCITGDQNPLHTNPEYAKKQGYSSPVTYGMLTASFLSALAGMYLPGKYSLIQSVELKFTKPVFPKNTLTITGTVTELHTNLNMMQIKVLICDETGRKVLKGKMQIGFLPESPSKDSCDTDSHNYGTL